MEGLAAALKQAKAAKEENKGPLIGQPEKHPERDMSAFFDNESLSDIEIVNPISGKSHQ